MCRFDLLRHNLSSLDRLAWVHEHECRARLDNAHDTHCRPPGLLEAQRDNIAILDAEINKMLRKKRRKLIHLRVCKVAIPRANGLRIGSPSHLLGDQGVDAHRHWRGKVFVPVPYYGLVKFAKW